MNYSITDIRLDSLKIQPLVQDEILVDKICTIEGILYIENNSKVVFDPDFRYKVILEIKYLLS